MFEQIIQKKLGEAVKIIDTLPDFSKESIGASRLSDYIINFLLTDYILQDRDYIIKNIDKAIKLHINYTLRPKWTLINYIFGGSDSRTSKEILRKLEPFTYYSYYIDLIRQIALDGEQVSVKKVEVEAALKHINNEIYTKLTTETTGLKVKNFFLFVFRMKYGDTAEISLDMSVPFLYIRLFLEDKDYSETLLKFRETGRYTDSTEIELKNLIKILTNKTIILEEPLIKEIPDKRDEETAGETIIEETFSQNVHAHKTEEQRDETIFETAEESRKKTELPTEEIDVDKTGMRLRSLFKEEEIKLISKKVFRGNRYAMLDSLIEIEKLANWREATNYLRNVFDNNKVKYSDKEVILFVDVLNDYFEKRNI